MAVIGPVQKLSEYLVRRKWRKLHPSVGLPKDAPEYLETENGSFIRPCPEDEWIPFAARALGVAWQVPLVLIILIGGLCMVAVIFYVVSRYRNGLPLDQMPWPLILLPVLPNLLGLPAFIVWAERSMKRTPRLLLRRRSRLFDPEDASFTAQVDDRSSFPNARVTADEIAVVRVRPGFLGFEMSRAQVRVAAEDMKLYLGGIVMSAWGRGLNIRCDFGNYEWSIVIGTYKRLRATEAAETPDVQFHGPERYPRNLAHSIQRSMEMPEEDIGPPPRSATLPKVSLPLVVESDMVRPRPVWEVLSYLAFFGTGIACLANLAFTAAGVLSGSGWNVLWAPAAVLGLIALFWWFSTFASLYRYPRKAPSHEGEPADQGCRADGSASGFVIRGFVVAAVVTGLAILALVDLLITPSPADIVPPPWPTAAFFAMLSALWWYLAYLELRRVPRRTWIFDDGGIRYEEAVHPPIEMTWKDVERVRWAADSVELRNSETTIVMRSDDESMAKARQVIQRKLAPEFDFEIRRPVPSKVQRTILTIFLAASLLLVMIVTLPGMLLFFKRWDRMDMQNALIHLGVVAASAVPMLGVICLGIRRYRFLKRLNPEWRERKRKKADPGSGPQSGGGGNRQES